MCLNKGFAIDFDLIWFCFHLCVCRIGAVFDREANNTGSIHGWEDFFHICFLLAFFPFISTASRGFALLVSRSKTGALNDEYIENTV